MDYKPIMLVLLLAGQSFAQSAFDPLSVGMGARALGMGRASVAVAGEGDTIFSNPAGLGEIDHFKATSMSANLLSDLHYVLLGGIYPLGKKGALGFGYTSAFISGIEIRDASGTLSRRANFGNSVGLISYGRKLTESTSLGINLKYYLTDGTEIEDGDGRGWNLDVGILQNGLEWLSFGLVGQNIISSSKINYQSAATETLPLLLKAGTKMTLLGEKFSAAIFFPLELVLMIDTHFDFEKPNPFSLHSGIELSPYTYFTTRAGWDEGNFTAGLSIKLAGIGFHYAYHTYGEFTENFGHYFSITLDERGWLSEEPPDTFLSQRKPSL